MGGLIKQYLGGNHNPGIGTKNLFKDIFYLRARDGGRVFSRKTKCGIEILAKASKEVIKILMDMYK